ncbi:MAG: exosortase system-associated protein, TIGR04073 family [Candidatus Omnitrophota bacterium]
MKKVVALVVVFGMIMTLAGSAYADDALKKLGRGMANVITCPLEVVKGMDDAKQESGIFAACTWGVIQGSFKTLMRAAVGVYEIATFPIPIPEDYQPILTDPEFFLQKDH